MTGNTRRAALGAALAIAASGLLSTAAFGQGATHTVAQDGSGDFTTINEAVAAAQEGDTILVGPGTYPEYVVVDKTITLQGDGAREAIVIESPVRPVIDEVTGEQEVDEDTKEPNFIAVGLELVDSDATISGLTVMGPADRGDEWDPEIYVDGGAPTIADVTVISAINKDGDPNVAISLLGSAASVSGNDIRGHVIAENGAPTIEGNDVAASIWLACYDDAETGYVADCSGADQAIVRGNTTTGISTFERTTSIIEGNTIAGPRLTQLNVVTPAGLVIWGGGQDFGTAPTVSGNTVTGHDVGIFVQGAVGGSLSGNTVTGNETGVTVGSDLMVDGNTISDNGIGLKVEAGAKPSIAGNTIESNELGIDLQRFAAPAFADNVICNAKNITALGGDPPSLDGNEVCEVLASG